MDQLVLRSALTDSLALTPWEHWKGMHACVMCALNYVSANCRECEETIRSYRSEWVNGEIYQGVNISLSRVMMILPPPEHAPWTYAATRHGFWLRELVIWSKTGKSMTALVVLCLTQSNPLMHCAVELCALTTGTTVSKWATATIDNNLDDMMDVETQELRATCFRQRSSWILGAHEEAVSGTHWHLDSFCDIYYQALE